GCARALRGPGVPPCDTCEGCRQPNENPECEQLPGRHMNDLRWRDDTLRRGRFLRQKSGARVYPAKRLAEEAVMKSLVAAALFATLVSSFAAHARAQGPDFSGTWKMDPARSESAETNVAKSAAATKL